MSGMSCAGDLAVVNIFDTVWHFNSERYKLHICAGDLPKIINNLIFVLGDLSTYNDDNSYVLVHLSEIMYSKRGRPYYDYHHHHHHMA